MGGPINQLPPNAPKDIPAKYLEQQVYTVRVTKVFKGYQKLRQIGNNRSRARSRVRIMRTQLFTPSKISSCHRVWLKKGGIYLVGGAIVNDRLYINSCSWVSKWKEMSRRERKNLKWHYGRNCKCHIHTCYGRRGCRSRGKMMCSYDRAAPRYLITCRTKYQYCKLDPVNQSCAWHKTPEFKSCMNKVNE